MSFVYRGKKPGRVPKPFDSWIDKTDGCWNWIGSVDEAGYGRHLRDRAHRTAYRLAYGPIPAGLCVMHKCDNTRCVNPDHLSLGTRDDNNKDRAAKNRSASKERHPKAILSSFDVDRIREQHINGATIASITRSWPVARTTVTQIVTNQIWRTP